MSVIAIPSKNIYDNIPQKISANSEITAIEQSENQIVEEYGNILAKEYRLVLHEIKFESNGNPDITYVGNDTNNTEGFELTLYNNDSAVRGSLNLLIQKQARLGDIIKKGEYSTFENHKLKLDIRIYNTIAKIYVDSQYLVDVKITDYNSSTGVIQINFDQTITTSYLVIVSITISLVGDYIAPREITKKIGDGEKVFQLPTNEIIQSSNTELANVQNKIINEYKNSKETMVLLCSISDYFDYHTKQKVISLSNDNLPMTLSINDKVIPLSLTGDGKDSPISKNEDGSPKIFRIVGIEFYYDGATWQKITIQETND